MFFSPVLLEDGRRRGEDLKSSLNRHLGKHAQCDAM